jgi:hypothetical protein
MARVPMPGLRSVRYVLLVLAAGSAPALAHHSVLGFDSSRSVTVRGVVARVVWGDPHVYVAVDAGAVGGSAERWIIEGESPRVLERLGWTQRSVQAGDRISSAGAPARDGTRMMRCDFVATAGDARLPCYPSGPGGVLEK